MRQSLTRWGAAIAALCVLVAFGTFGAILLRGRTSGVNAIHLRLVDRAREAAQSIQGEGSAANATPASEGPPTATIADDTRYVLFDYPHEPIFYTETLAPRAEGVVQTPLKLPPALRHAERLALVRQVRARDHWKELPPVAVASQRYLDEAWIGLELPVEGAEAGAAVGVHVEAFALDERVTTSVRYEPTRIPRGARLELGMGILEPAWSQGPVVFEVKACEGDDCVVLHSEQLDPGQQSGRKWVDRSLSLEPYGEKTVSLDFETRRTRGDADAFSLPVWGNPTVYVPTERDQRDINVILLSIDTLAAGHLPTYGYGQNTAPFIDEAFADGGTVFDMCIAATTATPASHMTMLTSVQPCVHGLTTGVEVLPSWLRTLADELRSAGYETGAITEDGWLSVRNGFGRGFNSFVENKSADPLIPEGQVDLTLSKAADWLRHHGDKRFFLFLHTFQVHNPYTPPAAYQNLFSSYDGVPVGQSSPHGLQDRAKYDREIRYTDDELRKFFGVLTELGLDRDTVFILTSDHGEQFLEHGYWGHGAQFYEEVMHVPLMFWGPGRIPAGRRVGGEVTHADLAPTILELAGVPLSQQMRSNGRSLAPQLGSAPAPQMEPRTIFAESWGRVAFLGQDYEPVDFLAPAYMLQVGDRRLARYRNNTGFEYQYYDLETDPKEGTNLFGKAAESLEYRAKVDAYEGDCKQEAAWLAVHASEIVNQAPETIELDPAQQEKLRALGYLK